MKLVAYNFTYIETNSIYNPLLKCYIKNDIGFWLNYFIDSLWALPHGVYHKGWYVVNFRRYSYMSLIYILLHKSVIKLLPRLHYTNCLKTKFKKRLDLILANNYIGDNLLGRHYRISGRVHWKRSIYLGKNKDSN